MSMTPPGLNFGGQAQHPKYGRERWHAQLTKVEGDIIYFHLIDDLRLVPGLSGVVSQLPFTYYRHWVPGEILGAKKNISFPVYCLASPGGPDAAGNWPLTPAGADACSRLILPSGQGLHGYGDPEPVVVFATFVHEQSTTPVREPRALVLRRSPSSKGPWGAMRRLYPQRVSQGGTPENMVWTLERTADNMMAVDCTVVRPGEPWAERFPFGAAQHQTIQSCASELVKFFLPPHTAEDIIKDLQVDPRVQSAAPQFQGGTSGPGAAVDMGV